MNTVCIPKGCRREYVVEWDIPEDNKIKEERYINDGGEKLTLNPPHNLCVTGFLYKSVIPHPLLQNQHDTLPL